MRLNDYRQFSIAQFGQVFVKVRTEGKDIYNSQSRLTYRSRNETVECNPIKYPTFTGIKDYFIYFLNNYKALKILLLNIA